MHNVKKPDSCCDFGHLSMWDVLMRRKSAQAGGFVTLCIPTDRRSRPTITLATPSMRRYRFAPDIGDESQPPAQDQTCVP